MNMPQSEYHVSGEKFFQAFVPYIKKLPPDNTMTDSILSHDLDMSTILLSALVGFILGFNQLQTENIQRKNSRKF